jgi:hypothetical protein
VNQNAVHCPRISSLEAWGESPSRAAAGILGVQNEVFHTNSHSTTTTAEETCTLTVVSQFVDGQLRANNSNQTCRPNP